MCLERLGATDRETRVRLADLYAREGFAVEAVGLLETLVALGQAEMTGEGGSLCLCR